MFTAARDLRSRAYGEGSRGISSTPFVSNASYPPGRGRNALMARDRPAFVAFGVLALMVLALVAAAVGCGKSEPSGSSDRAASLGVVSDEAHSAEPAETPDPAEQAREEAAALAEGDDFAAAARTLASADLGEDARRMRVRGARVLLSDARAALRRGKLKTAKRLAALGIDTVDQLAASDARVLAAEIGPTMGPWFHRLGRGVDTSPVDATPWVPRAHGREETFQQDLDDWDEVAEAVRRITRRAVEDIDAEGRPAARVGLKIRLKPFRTLSRSLTLPEPTNDPDLLADAAVSLLDRVEHDRPVRLLGVRLEMVPPDGGYLDD